MASIAGVPFTEDMEPRPKDDYGRSKANGEGNSGAAVLKKACLLL